MYNGAVKTNSQYIRQQSQLEQFCEPLFEAPYVAVDTEFLSEGTYRAKLCLIQLGYKDHCAVIDALCGLDLSIVWDLLAEQKVIKVLHACESDMQIFFDDAGLLPQPLFDTQIAAMVCGYGNQVGFSRLVDSLCGVRIDKSQQMTDWSHRPLGKRQIDYALNDVVYLCPIFEKLSRLLIESGRQQWVIEEMAEYLVESRYRQDPNESWRRVKIVRPTSRQLAILRELAAWRETQAALANKPRAWIMKDVALSELARHAPTSLSDLSRIRMLPKTYYRGAKAKQMLDLVKKGLKVPADQCPQAPKRKQNDEVDEEAVALLSALLKLCSEEQSVAVKLIATRHDLENFVRDPSADHRFTRGWRADIFGQEAHKLVNGELALTLGKGKIKRLDLTTLTGRGNKARKKS